MALLLRNDPRQCQLDLVLWTRRVVCNHIKPTCGTNRNAGFWT